jgi:hypothetical protein
MTSVPNDRQTLDEAVLTIDRLVESRTFRLDLASLLLNMWIASDDLSPTETVARFLVDAHAYGRGLLTPEQRYERQLAEAQRQYEADRK